MTLDFKAQRLLPFIKEERGNSCNFYTMPKIVKGLPVQDSFYMVIENEYKNQFSCNCLYFALKQKECSHILAAKMFKEKNDSPNQGT